MPGPTVAKSVPAAIVTPASRARCIDSACRSTIARILVAANGGTLSTMRVMRATIARVETRIAPASRIAAADSSSR